MTKLHCCIRPYSWCTVFGVQVMKESRCRRLVPLLCYGRCDMQVHASQLNFQLEIAISSTKVSEFHGVLFKPFKFSVTVIIWN